MINILAVPNKTFHFSDRLLENIIFITKIIRIKRKDMLCLQSLGLKFALLHLFIFLSDNRLRQFSSLHATEWRITRFQLCKYFSSQKTLDCVLDVVTQAFINQMDSMLFETKLDLFSVKKAE